MGEYSWGSTAGGGGSAAAGRVAVHVYLTVGQNTYTVPAGKQFVGEWVYVSGAVTPTVNGSQACVIGGTAQPLTPLRMNAGDVAAVSPGNVSITGFLYDV